MSDYNLGRWDWAWLVECETCTWHMLAQDRPYVEHGGYVHVEFLQPGHELINSEARKVFA